MDAPELEPEKVAERRADLFRERRRLKDQALSARLAIFLVGPLATLLTALILIFFVFFEHSIVSGPSMLPTLRGGDYVLATKGLPDPMHGDIVILNVVYKGVREEWVKRIVGLPGDRVDVRGDIILINGTAESFRHLTITGDATIPVQTITVPAGQVFVAGDNRPVSEDSRYVGTFPLTSIRGRVVFIYAPTGRFGPVSGPPR
jgi:signal peptidase I